MYQTILDQGHVGQVQRMTLPGAGSTQVCRQGVCRAGVTRHRFKATVHQDSGAKWTAMPPRTSGRRLDSWEVSWPGCAVSSFQWPRLMSTTASDRARLEHQGRRDMDLPLVLVWGRGVTGYFFHFFFSKIHVGSIPACAEQWALSPGSLSLTEGPGQVCPVGHHQPPYSPWWVEFGASGIAWAVCPPERLGL